MNKTNYRDLREKLDRILAELESDDLDVDQALILHKKGQDVVAQMERYLKETEASIKKLPKKK